MATASRRIRRHAASTEQLRSGILGLLVGDAVGVPYEFRLPEELPPREQIDMIPPEGFMRTYAHVPLGTWSDDGAQALCLLASLQACGYYHPHDFAKRLLRWHDHGYMAVDHYVFDIGNQTSVSIARLKKGHSTDVSGLCGERNNGNGSLMRCLPLALTHRGNNTELVIDAHRQSKLTHGHPRAQVCCALFCLWARFEMYGQPEAWTAAMLCLRELYCDDSLRRHELDGVIQPEAPACGTGTGYVVDCLHSARWACQGKDYREIIQRAVSLGHDTDTTACVAGGIAGLRHGAGGIPEEWVAALRGKDILDKILPV
ncbi:MAG: ADP-ribosylglycohydrolase family protein [Verrucomicrobiota bacterium]